MFQLGIVLSRCEHGSGGTGSDKVLTNPSRCAALQLSIVRKLRKPLIFRSKHAFGSVHHLSISPQAHGGAAQQTSRGYRFKDELQVCSKSNSPKRHPGRSVGDFNRGKVSIALPGRLDGRLEGRRLNRTLFRRISKAVHL